MTVFLWQIVGTVTVLLAVGLGGLFLLDRRSHRRELTAEQQALAARLRAAADELCPPIDDTEDAWVRFVARLNADDKSRYDAGRVTALEALAIALAVGTLGVFLLVALS